MSRPRQIVPITAPGNELHAEIVEVKADLARLQRQARESGNWKMEVAMLDRRLKIIELRLREVRDYSTNVMQVNFDVDAKVAERMAISFLARQRELRENGELDAK